MRISLIVTTYNRPNALLLVLKSIELQTMIPHEVLVADDGSDYKTHELVANFNLQTKLNIVHCFQKDNGFRAARSRNKAISKATGQYIILIDGDMVLHPDFIQDHLKNSCPGFFIQGSRVLMNKKLTEIVLKEQILKFHLFSQGISNRLNTIHSNFLSQIFSIQKNYLRGIKTCNMSFFKEDCISVNGFNNNFEGWGREDSEFIVRLMNKGVRRKTLKFLAIQFHLWHNEDNQKSLDKNNSLLKLSIDSNLDWCDSGIDIFL
jgi:glycosyltransferase involved in cell wall biosynthesis